MRIRVRDPLIPVLIPDQVDQGYWVIRLRCESANIVPRVRIKVLSVRERVRKTQICTKNRFSLLS